MQNIVDETFAQWVRGRTEVESRIAIYNAIRDIPYAVIPELNDPLRYREILALHKGSCTPKHFLLCAMYQKLGLEVLYAVYTFRWDEFEHLYPADLRKLVKSMPAGNHLACKVKINSKYVLVDATVDPPLRKAGFPVTISWGGVDDTVLPVVPCGPEQLYHPSEADLMQKQIIDEQSLAFYARLNQWLERLRSER